MLGSFLVCSGHRGRVYCYYYYYRHPASTGRILVGVGTCHTKAQSRFLACLLVTTVLPVCLVCSVRGAAVHCFLPFFSLKSQFLLFLCSPVWVEGSEQKFAVRWLVCPYIGNGMGTGMGRCRIGLGIRQSVGDQGPLLYVYTIFRAYCFEFVQCARVLLPLLHARGRRGCLSGWGSSFLSIYLPTYVITAAAWHASALLYCKLSLRAFLLSSSLFLICSAPCEAN